MSPAGTPAPPRHLRDPASRAAFAAAVPLAAVAGAALATAIADALDLSSADARFVTVTLGIALPIWLGRIARPESNRITRIVVTALGLPWIAAALAPQSPLAVTWLAGGVVVLGLDAVAHAAVTAFRLGTTAASRAALAALVALPALYLYTATFVVLFNTQLIMAPVRLFHLTSPRDPAETELTLHTEDGYTLAATYTSGTTDTGVVLVHGVADARSRLLPWARRLNAAGHHVLRFDVRGHGQSDGAVVTYGQREVADVRAAVAALRSRGAERIAVVGTSMGGGIVLAAASEIYADRVRALILLAPASRFPPLVAQRVAFLGPFADPVLAGSARIARAMGQIPMTEWIPAVYLGDPMSALVLHGTDDTTIPIALSERLARERDNVELVRLDAVGHDDLPAASAADDATWREHVTPFLQRSLR